MLRVFHQVPTKSCVQHFPVNFGEAIYSVGDLFLHVSGIKGITRQ